jgi:capsule polysaccharide export protein KpsE/RkpR
VRLHEQVPASPILQRLKAEKAYREVERREARLRLAARVRIIWAERTFSFRIAALGLILGLLVAFLIPARYTSTARLMPPDNQGASIPQAAMSLRSMGISQIATDVLGLKSNSAVFVGILNSRTVQDKIIEQFELKRVYWTNRMDDARLVLASHVSVSVDIKNDIILISVTDRSPQRAAAIANAYVTELNRLVVELSTSSARRERIFLESYLVQAKQDLENAEKEFSQFASKNTTIDIKEQGKAMVEAAATLQGQYIAAQTELEGLKQIYTDSNVRVRSVSARIAELKRQLEKLGGKGEQTSDTSGKSEGYLYPSVRKLPLLGVAYADLYRQIKVLEVVYELLTQEYSLAKVQEARDTQTVRVLDPPNIPEKKSFPPRLLIAASFTFLAIAVGILVVFGSRSWNDGDPRDLRKAVAMEIWIDLKEKRFLTPGNNLERSGAASSNSLPRKSGILSFLGLNDSSRHPNESFSPSESFSEREPSETKLPDTLNA